MFSLFEFVCCLVSWILLMLLRGCCFGCFFGLGLGWFVCLAGVVVVFVMYCVLVWLLLVWICWFLILLF